MTTHTTRAARITAADARDPDPTGNAAGAAGQGRLRLVAAALATSAVTLAALVVTHPWGPRLDSSSDEVFSYGQLLEYREAAWPSMLVDGFAYGILAVCAAVAVCHLVAGRGRVAALVGSVATVAGGLLFAMGAAGHATLAWYATSPGLSGAAGCDLIGYVNDNPVQVLAPQMAGFALVTLGTLILAVALFRGRTVPRVLVLAFVLATVLLFVELPGDAMNIVQAAQLLLVGAVAVPLWCSVAHRHG